MILFKSLSRVSDPDLMALVSQGDERAFGELVNRYQDAVYGFAFRMLTDVQEAEDVAQETFLRLYTMARRYRPEASLKTFLLCIAKNLCIDYYRKKRPQLMDELPDMESPETPLILLETAIDSRQLEKAIGRLPDNQRAALLLRHTEAMPYTQIAETLNTTVSAVESLLVRARRNLHKQLSE